ncbi:MAG: hypothetical protein ACOYME_02950, partial [Prochlorotrichaceae cyanobacterium]
LPLYQVLPLTKGELEGVLTSAEALPTPNPSQEGNRTPQHRSLGLLKQQTFCPNPSQEGNRTPQPSPWE